jgi:hypothetical protein
MPAKRIPQLDNLTGAASATDDKVVIYDVTANVTKAITRVELGKGIVGDLPYTPSGGIAATTIPTAIAELDTEAAKSATLAAAGGAALIGNTPAGTIAATTVQAALNELDTEKTTLANVLARLDDNDGSSLVGYTQGGTGASNTTVQAKLRETVSVKDFGAVGDGVTDDTVSIQNAIDAVAIVGGQVFFPSGEYVVSKQGSNQAAILLPDWVSLEGASVGTSGGAVTGSRIKLANGQNVHVLGNFTVAGVSGSCIKNLIINANRANNTAGSGIYYEAVLSSSIIDNVKIGQTADHGIEINSGGSVPIWFTNIFTGANGKSGVSINCANATGIHLLNIQIDNCGLAGGGDAGIYLNAGSTNNTNVCVQNYRFEQNTTVDAAASGLGIQLNNMNLATILVQQVYGFSNESVGTVADFIKVTGTSARLSMLAITTSNAWINIYNDVVNSKTIAYSTSGVQAFTPVLDVKDILRVRSATTNGICTMSTSAGSGRLTVNKLSDGGTGGNVDFFQGADSKKANIDTNGSFWSGGGTIKLSGTSESASNCLITNGTGTPEGVITAKVGSLFLRIDGGASTTLYVKESGTGNTGWVAK